MKRFVEQSSQQHLEHVLSGSRTNFTNAIVESLQIYNTYKERKQEISVLPDELIVNDILEPLSNKQRLQIMKAIAIEAKNFSALSELTGLRGGNLLFHLQKLLDSGVILQRHERGDYMITDKGFKVLRSVIDMYSVLQTDRKVIFN